MCAEDLLDTIYDQYSNAEAERSVEVLNLYSDRIPRLLIKP